MPGIQQCETDFHNAIVDNVLSAENIFRLAKVPVIFISSQAAKYPTSKYAIMKLICETMALKMGHSVLRLANVYGGEYYLELKTSVIANFINAKKNNKSMVIVGNGEQIRDFIHVSEVCQAIEMAFGKEKIIVDVGTGVGRSINEIANMMEYDNIIYDHSNNMNIESNISDINPAKEILSFVAKDELESYIRMMH
jgi:UDP-glucose 4-epimerase